MAREILQITLKGSGHIQHKEEMSHCRRTCCHWPKSNLRLYHWPPSKSKGPQLSRNVCHRTDSLSTFNVSCWWSDTGCYWEDHIEEEHSSGCSIMLNHEPNNYCGGCFSCYVEDWLATSWNCCHFHIRINDLALSSVVWSWRLLVFQLVSRLLHRK